jgi:hypothetical protein
VRIAVEDSGSGTPGTGEEVRQPGAAMSFQDFLRAKAPPEFLLHFAILDPRWMAMGWLPRARNRILRLAQL